MAEFRITYRAKALAFFESKRVDERIKRIVLDKIDVLAKHPYLGKPLSGEFRGYRRLAVSYYRVIYHIVESELIVDVVQIGLRRDVYDA